MQKRSHALLASALLRCEEGFPARRYELAFLLGSVQPDCNPLSYLKGSLRRRKFGGHTYGNSRPYIDSRIRRLQNRSRWNIWQYYTLGKLTHYVADAFTWPHNPTFPARGWAHHQYEKALRLEFREYLSGQPVRRLEPCRDLPEQLADLHGEYLAGTGGIDRDMRYILRANELLMAGCRRTAPAAGRF